MAKRHGLIEALDRLDYAHLLLRLSVAKRHGLIEADSTEPHTQQIGSYPWQNATASLKRGFGMGRGHARHRVIRGKTPQPH